MKLLRVALVLAFIFSGMGWLQAEEANWQVGLARIDITPTRPILMDGYASRREPFEAVASPIHAKAIALKDEAGNRALLINAEILGFHDELSERIARRINESTGLPREAILISATHTHSGPMVLPIALGGEVPEAQWQEVLRYSRELEDKVVEISQKALQEMSPAQISWGVGSAPFVSNRREFTEKGVILGLNPEGPVDRSVPVLRVDGLDGNPSAVLFGTACHCTTLGGKNYHICGDYAGFAQDCVEQAHGGAQAMFVTGCAGDANPNPRGTMELAQAHGKSLGDEVCRVLSSSLAPVHGPLSMKFRRVDLPLQPFSRAEVEAMAKDAPGYHKFFAELAAAMLEQGKELPRTYSAPLALWQFGDDLTLVGFCGETVVDYVSFTRQSLGPEKLWVAGYCNDVFGYLPSARVLKEGGYETRGLYTAVGLFAPEVEQVVMNAIREMAAEAGRELPEKAPR